MFFADQGALDENRVLSLAAELNLEVSALADCRSGEGLRDVERDLSEAARFGIRTTQWPGETDNGSSVARRPS
jgi:hypothetical protein